MESVQLISRVNSGFLFAFVLVIGLGSITFGYLIGVFNNMQENYKLQFGIPVDEKNNPWVTYMNTSLTVGFAIGALFSAPFMKYGKKLCIHFTNLIIVIGCGVLMVKN